ncbi:MAG TPA: glucokinase [Nitrospirota bacterium]|nr:glucokinase [Nitrospirota bacterium]
MKMFSRSSLILAGDIGGTKTLLGLCQSSEDGIRLIRAQNFASKAFGALKKIIKEFISDTRRIKAACFGVAGPVIAGTVVTTNLPWQISETSLKRFLSIRNVSLINDLIANAHGIEVMQKKDFSVLNAGKKEIGNRALLSAGTGLGAAILFWNGKRYIPSPSEGGHVEFGPRNLLELGLLRYLLERFGHVSYERVLSGAGLLNIYQFLRDTGKFGREPAWLAVQMEQEDPAAVITEMARLKKSKLCEAALGLFTSIYGAAAGNVALQVMATGGMYIGGGIAPKIIWKLKDGTFMKAFTDKGRLSSMAQRIPVEVIMNDWAALLGAAAHAADLLKKG